MLFSQGNKYDLAFDAVLQTIPQVNNESLHRFCKERFTNYGRGCLYVAYSNFHEMLHTDQHRFAWKPLSFLQTLSYQPVLDDIAKYDPEKSYILLVSCASEDGSLLFKHKIINGQTLTPIPPPQFRQQLVHLPICSKCKQPKNDLKRCSVCSSVLYCSKECQREDWKEHKKVCPQLQQQTRQQAPLQAEHSSM